MAKKLNISTKNLLLNNNLDDVMAEVEEGIRATIDEDVKIIYNYIDLYKKLVVEESVEVLEKLGYESATNENMRYIAAGGTRIKNLPILLTLPFFENCTIKVDYDDHDYEVRGVFPNVFTIPKRRIGIIGEITLFNSVGFNDEYTAHRHNLLNEIQRKGLLE